MLYRIKLRQKARNDHNSSYHSGNWYNLLTEYWSEEKPTAKIEIVKPFDEISPIWPKFMTSKKSTNARTSPYSKFATPAPLILKN